MIPAAPVQLLTLASSGLPEKGFGSIHMRPLHRLAFLFLALAFLSAAPAIAQARAIKPLIIEKVDDNNLVTLKGNTPPAAAVAANDRGSVNPGMAMSGLILALRRSPEQQAAFEAFVASQYDSTSPNFHHWLEPVEVGKKFGPAPEDIAAVSNWLSGHGLTVEAVSNDRMTIRFSGTAAEVEQTFHTEIHNLMVRGEPHISNMSDPQIPIALEPVVLGPKALHNFIPQPMHRVGGKVMLNSETGRWEKVAGTSPFDLSMSSSKTTPRPELGINVGSGTGASVLEDLTPYDFATIYNVLPLWNNNIDGTGQTIAVAGRSDISLTDVANFRSVFGLPAKAPNIIHNGADPGACTSTSSTALCTLDDQIENALDVEWAGAIAKGATIDLVVTAQTSTNDAIYESSNYVIQNKTATILNVSYGECELGLGTAGNATYNTLWSTAASAGIAVMAAAGDSGSSGCDQGQSSTTPYSANFGLSVSGIASSAFDTAVGGTDFTWCNPTVSALCTSGSPYWGASNSASTGENAQGYVPETPWNDTCTTPAGINYIKSLQQFAGGSPTVVDAESACNYINTNWPAINTKYGFNSSFFVNTEGGGGGASNCTTSDGSHQSSCTGGYAKPSWQTGVTGIPNDNKRDIPDVSFFAGAGLWNTAYIICVSASGTCLSSTTNPVEPTGEEIGGTSAASPTMAGVMALINQKTGSAQGNPNVELYALAAKQTYSNCSAQTVTTSSSSCYFNDPDTGTNAMPCTAGSPNCTVSTTGDAIGVLAGFSAGVGFDNATGLGSLNVANVVNGWTSSTGTAAATVSVSANPTSFTSAQSTTVTVTVAGSSGTPTGTVFLTSGTFSSPTHTLSSGSATFTLASGVLAVGADTITATYSGDSVYASNTGTTQVTVTQATLLPPTVTVTPASGSIDSGQSLNVTAAVTGSGVTPTGTVTISGGGYTSSAQALASGSYTFVIPANSLSAGTDTLTVSYSGDSVYASGSSTASVSVTPSVYKLSATSPSAINAGGSATSTISPSTTTNFGGTVTLTCALNSGGPSNQAGDAPNCSAQAGSIAMGSTGTATVTTTAASTASISKPRMGGWAEAGGGAVLALLLFFGIPSRRSGWRAMLGVLVLMLALGGLGACGGGGGGGGGNSNPGTTAGTYTFTVTGTGSDPAKTQETTTFTVTVN